MIHRRQRVVRSAAIMLMFASIGYAQADDANESIAEVRADLKTVYGADIASTNRTDIRTTADAGGDQADVIEEIVVIGNKKRRLPNLGSSLGNELLVPKPGRIDWQILPTYDPEQAYLDFELFKNNEEIRRAGFIELFRIRFGGR